MAEALNIARAPEPAEAVSAVLTSPLPRPAVASAVDAVLSVPDDRLDYALAKLALDRIVDPSIDDEWALAELDRLTEAGRRLTGASADEMARLAALRRLIYESGPWNGHRPFAYDHDHPDGTHIPQKLLSAYLRTRLGNCVSMPILFLILGERLGLDLALARAPHHIFVRHHLRDGRIGNLETTSGAHPAGDEWFRLNMRIGDLGVRTGLYMRSLTRREAIAAMATIVLEHLAAARRWMEVVAASEAILLHSPREAHALLSLGSACGTLLNDEFAAHYSGSYLIPPHLRPRYLILRQRGEDAFAAAEALGWEPTQ